MELFFLLLIPIVWVCISKYIWPHEISIGEMCVHLAVSIALIVIVYGIAMFSSISDKYYIHSMVTHKEQVRVPCSHSYSCNCRTVRSGKYTSTRCSTCYLHSHDYDWRVYAGKQYVNIDRVDLQGRKEPERFTKVQIKEPFTYEASFKNYIANVPNSLFSKFKDVQWVAYPSIYDYYRYNPVIIQGLNTLNHKEWQDMVTMYSKVYSKGSDVLFIITSSKTNKNDYVEKIKGVWKGGKLNSVIVVLGVSPEKKIEWVDSFTYGNNRDNELLIVKIRDTLLEKPLAPSFVVSNVFYTVSKYYTPVQESDFDYLQNELTLSKLALILIVLFNLMLNAGLTYIMIQHNPSYRNYYY